MAYYKKYLKYKNKYINLKKTLGGSEHINITNLNSLKNNDIYIYDYNGFRYLFNLEILENIYKFNTNDKIKKDITKGLCNEGPILEIEIDTIDSSGKIKFIRSKNDDEKYKFQTLLKMFTCLMKHLNIQKIKLDDNALFYSQDCEYSYSSLMFRAFEGKNSLYISNNMFQPNFMKKNITKVIKNINDYNIAIKNLNKSTCGQWSSYLKKISDVYNEVKDVLHNTFFENLKKNDIKMIDFFNEMRETKKYNVIGKILNNISSKDFENNKFRGVDITQNNITSADPSLYILPRDIFLLSNELINSDYVCMS